MQEAALLVCGACMVNITKKYRPIRYGSESLQPKYFAWRDQTAISFYMTSMVFVFELLVFIQNCNLRIVIENKYFVVGIFLKTWHIDIVATTPVPSTNCSGRLVTLFTKEYTVPFKSRNICMEVFIFHQKIIAMVVCTFPCKLNKSCFWIVRNLYNIKQASGALCWYRCMCMWIQWNSVIVLLSVYEIWERSVRVSCFTRYPHRNTS